MQLWTDAGSIVINCRALSADCVVQVRFIAEIRTDQLYTGIAVYQRFRIGSYYSNEASVVNNSSYSKVLYTISLPIGMSGVQTVTQQLYTDGFPNNAIGRKSDPDVMIEVLVP